MSDLIHMVKKKQVASLPFLHKLALKYILDRKRMRSDEQALFEFSIENWPKKTDITDSERKELNLIIKALIENENGRFGKIKDMIRLHELDYNKMFPEGIA